jgi:hypothetical protein
MEEVFLFIKNGKGQTIEDANGNVYVQGQLLQLSGDEDKSIELDSASLRTLTLKNSGAGQMLLEIIGNILLDLNPNASNTQKYRLEQGNYHVDIQGLGAGQNAIVRLAAADGDTTDTVEYSLFARGTTASHADREQLKTIWVQCHADGGVTIGDGVTDPQQGSLAVKERIYGKHRVNYIKATRITTALTLTTATFEDIIYNNETSDADNVYNPSTGEITPTHGGQLHISAGIRTENVAIDDKQIIFRLYKNGAAFRELDMMITGSTSRAYRLIGHTVVFTTNTDTWKLVAYQDTGGDVDIPIGEDVGTFLEAFVVPDSPN